MDLGPSTASDDAGSSTAETPRRTCLLVLGMHRSGTSALARVLSLMGAALPKNLMGPGPGNETGHWEPAQIVQLHDHLLEELGSPWDDWNRIDVAALPPERLARYQSELRQIGRASCRERV